VTEWCIMTN